MNCDRCPFEDLCKNTKENIAKSFAPFESRLLSSELKEFCPLWKMIENQRTFDDFVSGILEAIGHYRFVYNKIEDFKLNPNPYGGEKE